MTNQKNIVDKIDEKIAKIEKKAAINAQRKSQKLQSLRNSIAGEVKKLDN